jgi:hypothetical protein
MDRSSRWARRVVAALASVALLAAVPACSGGSGDEDDAATTSTEPVETVTTSTTDAADVLAVRPTSSTTTTVRSRPGLPADALFVELAGMTYVDLDDLSERNLAARFAADERLDPVLDGVAARGVQIGDRLGAVVVSVSLTTTAAADLDFAEDFVAGVTADATAPPTAVTIGDQQLQRFDGPDGTANLLWAHENLYALVTSREPADLDAVATALVDAVTGSVPDPVLPPCPPGVAPGATTAPCTPAAPAG